MSELQFYCVVCGASLSTEPTSAGGVAECPSCERTVPIPGYPSVPGQPVPSWGVFAPEVLALTVSFRCGQCAAIISADARWEDQDIQCPRCAAMTKVPHWSGPRVGATPAFKLPTLSAEEVAFLSERQPALKS
jgi:DNA-directed RNA polymerase subunit RPC12/RpoP